MKVNITRNNSEIERGDIVHYDGKDCIVAEELFSPVCMLINLGSGLIVKKFEDINHLKRHSGVTLLAKGNEVELSNSEQEVPF